ncbi:uncharacterized protein LOC133871301 [Alnus glutinosa]|uniref:uncharacterized protein LOC133871301 n=1 Tax=Alnus glutinosa TaxID=3517 RepID=UPI002D78B220|nr:uncharacterized protein LOC133871301 [Alnus glutinosa]
MNYFSLFSSHLFSSGPELSPIFFLSNTVDHTHGAVLSWTQTTCPSARRLLGSSLPLSIGFEVMNWIQRKIYLYNVTFGLYMLDWWERYLFNTLVIVLMWFILYNGSRSVTEFCKRWGVHIKHDWQDSAAQIHGI